MFFPVSQKELEMFPILIHFSKFSTASHLDYVATPTSAPPTMGGVPPNGDVIITDESEVFTEGATVEIVETTPLLTPQSKSPRRKGAPAYRGRLLLK